MTLDLIRLICSKLRKNVCFCAASLKIYLARRDNGSYCDVKEACIYQKKQRRCGCQSWRTLIRLFLSFSIHTLYQWHSSSCAFVHDMDQIDFHSLSQHLQVQNVRRGRAWIVMQTLTKQHILALALFRQMTVLSPFAWFFQSLVHTSLLLRDMKTHAHNHIHSQRLYHGVGTFALKWAHKKVCTMQVHYRYFTK